MVKRRAIEIVTQTVEDKLDSNGALRNVAVKDAWKRFRQNIEVKSWKEAERVLQELTDSLQKINLLKSVSTFINKLKTAFQSPDEMVEENDMLAKETPREDKSRTLELANDLQKSLDEVSKLEDCLRTVKQKIETTDEPPSVLLPTTYVSSDMKNCYESLSSICEKYKRTARELEQNKSRADNSESKVKDLENQLEDRDSQLNHLRAAVDTLEKKHSTMKEQKMDTFKDQMKVKSLERQVEVKDGELKKAKEELSDLQQRFDDLMKSKSTDTSEANNPFPPTKIADKYMEVFKGERVTALNFYKTSQNKDDKDAAKRVIDILEACYTYCETSGIHQIDVLAARILNPSVKEEANIIDKDKIGEVEMKSIKNVCKTSCKKSVESVKNGFVTHLEEIHDQKFSLAEITGCLSYIEKCVEICWPAVLQATPVWIGFDSKPVEKTDVNTTVFDIADGKGRKVDYVLWPPLFTGKGGPVLKKGQIKGQ